MLSHYFCSDITPTNIRLIFLNNKYHNMFNNTFSTKCYFLPIPLRLLLRFMGKKAKRE